MPDPEVVDRRLRRRYSPSYKLRIVEEPDRCTEQYTWVTFNGERACTLAPDDVAQGGCIRRSLKALRINAYASQRHRWTTKVRKVERRQRTARDELRKAHLIIDVQGKVAGLLGSSRTTGQTQAADELAKRIGVKPAYSTALEVSRSTLYRRRGKPVGFSSPARRSRAMRARRNEAMVFDTLCVVSGSSPNHRPRWWPRCSPKRVTCTSTAR